MKEQGNEAEGKSDSGTKRINEDKRPGSAKRINEDKRSGSAKKKET